MTVEQKGLDISAKLSDPSGRRLFTADGLNAGWGPEFVPILGEKAGRYRLEVHGEGSGTYRITAEPRRKATLKDRKSSLAAAAYSRAKELIAQHRGPEAERQFQSALQLWKETGYKEGQADASFKLGTLQHNSHRPDEAKASLLIALPVYREVRNRHQEAIVLNELGLACMHAGQAAEALTFFSQAIRLAKELGAVEVEMDARFNRGKLNQDLGEFRQSFLDLERAFSMAKTRKDYKHQAVHLNALGRGYLLLGEIDAALKHHRNALRILKAEPDPETLIATFVHLGDAFRKKEDRKMALDHYLRAIRSSQELGGAEALPEAFNNLGLTYFHMKHPKEALDSLRKALGLYQRRNHRAHAPVTAINIGWLLVELGRYDEAFKIYREALAAVQAQGRRPAEAAAYFGMAWAEKQRGNLAASRRYLEKAIEIVESLRTKADRKRLRRSFLAGHQNFYDLLVEILMEQHRREPAKGFDVMAFEASEKARCRTLLDSVEGRLTLPSRSVREIQQRILAPQTILLEYFLGEEKSYLWAVTADTFTSFELPGRAVVEPLVREVHTLLAESNRLELRGHAARKALDLSRILFGPVASRLDHKQLLIVAPPELQYIPFAALPDPSSDLRPKGGAWPDPLLRLYEITVEPSATFLVRLRELHAGRRPPSSALAVIGDPVFLPPRVGTGNFGSTFLRYSHFRPLKHSRQEALAISKQAKGRVLLALGSRANRQLVLQGGLKGFRNLHFSAHGAPVKTDPEQSAIVLSGHDESGRVVETHLRAGEIARLELPADLVVLSACSTGLGKEIRGEGLVGLTQAFFSAGASRVVASLWDVDDAATARLMELFYQNLFEKEFPHSAALREAQLTMWRQSRWQPPSYWAGFVLQGEFH